MSLRSPLAALAIALALVPAAASAAPTRPAAARSAKPAAKAPARPAVDPAQAMAMMTKFFDRLFPVGPEPEPVRLAAARQMTMTMLPTGAYAEAMNGFVDRTAERMLDMSEADFAEMMPPSRPKKGEKAKLPSRVPLRTMLAEKEPNFDAKLAAGKAFARTMFGKVGGVMEPRFRDGLARAMARKFDAAQMAEINAFLATPTGAAYGRQMLGLWFEPEIMRGSFEAFPEMMKLFPELAKDAAAMEATIKDTDKGKGATEQK